LPNSWLQHRSIQDVPGSGPGQNWIEQLLPDLAESIEFRPSGAVLDHHPRILILYGSLRMPRSFSRYLAHESARLLEVMGAEVRVFDPHGLPVRDPAIEAHPKVQELRELVHWSEGHVWCAPELHGNVCGTFKNQIDWIPLNTGSVRPTQGKSCVVLQVNGGSQSFNTVNTLRILARWMRMACSVNQSSIPMAWQQFDDDGRLKESDFRLRVVDVMEEFLKFTRINREYSDVLTNRFSERLECREHGRLRSQAEKEELRQRQEQKDAENN
jgi:arsenic resistance protein ArsH